MWRWYGGEPLLLEVKHGEARTSITSVQIGSKASTRTRALVSAGAWQNARSLGAWTLISCAVALGFDFAKFGLAPHDWEP
jgi:uncharacterized protein